MTTFFILIATFLSGTASLIGAFLLSRAKLGDKTTILMTAFAAGVMLTTALLHLAPEATHELEEMGSSAFPIIFMGVIVFFLLERFVMWFHHHHDISHPKPRTLLISVGDTIHNMVDGAAIASAFLIDPRLGIMTAIAVGLHEIPQEMADFLAMVSGGVKSITALKLNLLSSVGSLIGAVLVIFLAEQVSGLVPYIVAFSAGVFLYISMSDLIPELHHHDDLQKNKWTQLLMFGLGIVLILSFTTVFEQVLPHDSEPKNQSIEETVADHIDE